MYGRTGPECVSANCTFAMPAKICPVPLEPGVCSFTSLTSNLENVKSSRGWIGSWCRLKRTKPCPLKPLSNASFASDTGTDTPPPMPMLTSRLDPISSPPLICACAIDDRERMATIVSVMRTRRRVMGHLRVVNPKPWHGPATGRGTLRPARGRANRISALRARGLELALPRLALHVAAAADVAELVDEQERDRVHHEPAEFQEFESFRKRHGLRVPPWIVAAPRAPSARRKSRSASSASSSAISTGTCQRTA